MTSCRHRTLELLPAPKARMRCRVCHLTLDADDLGDGCCPECFENDGGKRYEFEAVAPAEGAPARYRCVECGVVIDSR